MKTDRGKYIYIHACTKPTLQIHRQTDRNTSSYIRDRHNRLKVLYTLLEIQLILRFFVRYLIFSQQIMKHFCLFKSPKTFKNDGIIRLRQVTQEFQLSKMTHTYKVQSATEELDQLNRFPSIHIKDTTVNIINTTHTDSSRI